MTLYIIMQLVHMNSQQQNACNSATKALVMHECMPSRLEPAQGDARSRCAQGIRRFAVASPCAHALAPQKKALAILGDPMQKWPLARPSPH